MAPVVDGLGAEYEGKVSVRKINAATDETAAKFDIEVVPTYIFLDVTGKVIESQAGGNPDALRAGFERASGK
jgi:thioredoxin-like negative regulator of GroEL